MTRLKNQIIFLSLKSFIHFQTSRIMDFNQIRYFLALSNTLNFTKAAEQCYVTQPALTQAIKRLEAELGGDLIARNGRETELTELGKSLRSYFEQIERTQHMVRRTAKAVVNGETSELNIGVMCTIGPNMIGDLLDTFQMNHPRVKLILHDVVHESIPGLLLSGAIDGAFYARHGPANPRLEHVELFNEEMAITFPQGHPFARESEVSVRSIAAERYIERLHCEFGKEFRELFSVQGLNLNVVFQCEREDWIQSLIRIGMGVAVIPRYSVLQPGLDCKPVTDPKLTRVVEFVVPMDQTRKPALTYFMNEINSHQWPKA